ncbi:MAG: aspartate aminotransferase family protein [Acidobacteriota bacterium]|nr:aspartate aminotransferase family protein [Acidobacteriota bacterium]
MTSPRLRRGDLLPRMVAPPQGPHLAELSRCLDTYEAPGINTLQNGRAAVGWAEARGANVLDVEGNRYLDFTAGFGVAAVGHRHPKVMAALRRQSGRLVHGLGDAHPHPLRAQLAERLCRLAPVPDPLVYFAISGADAVEIALKTALLNGRGPGVLAFDPGYHGLTLGALAVTSRAQFRQPFASHLHHRLHRLPFGGDPAAVERLFAKHPEIGCAVVEPLVGREGVLIPPNRWLRDLAKICHRHGVLLVADEIFTGFGRTGHLFAVQGEGVEPDLLCCGKALGGGLPIAAVLGRRRLMEAWASGGEALHTGTFVAHPLACATSLAVLDVLEEESLADRARRLGERVETELQDWPRRFPPVVATRGRGLLWGVELDRSETAYRWVAEARRRGVLVLAGGPSGAVTQLVPPLTITERQLDTGLALLRQALTAVAEGGSSP